MQWSWKCHSHYLLNPLTTCSEVRHRPKQNGYLGCAEEEEHFLTFFCERNMRHIIPKAWMCRHRCENLFNFQPNFSRSYRYNIFYDSLKTKCGEGREGALCSVFFRITLYIGGQCREPLPALSTTCNVWKAEDCWLLHAGFCSCL